jgi:hypothetical protein
MYCELRCRINITSDNKNESEDVPALFLTEQQAIKAYWGSGGRAPRILDLGTRWRWVVSLTPQPLYSQGKSPWYPLDRMLDGGPKTSLDAVVRRKISSSSGIRNPDHLARSSRLLGKKNTGVRTATTKCFRNRLYSGGVASRLGS